MKIIFQDDSGNIIAEDSISEEEEVSLLTNMVDIPEWVSNAVHNKARKRMDDIVTRSGKGSKFTEKTDKLKIIANLKKENHQLLESVKIKNERQVAEKQELIEIKEEDNKNEKVD